MGARSKRARLPKGPPPRPESVPEDAFWDAKHETWCSGAMESVKRVGPWIFTYPDGTTGGRGSYVNGAFDGAVEWFHRSGDLRERATYVAGTLHGKQVWQRTKKGKSPGMEWFDKLGKDTWRYEVARAHGDGEARFFTFYGKAGVNEQVPATPEGRSIALGEHMDKLEPETVLMLVEECFIDDADEEIHAGSVARLSRGAQAARGRYIYGGMEVEDVYRLRFVYDDGSDPEEFFVDSSELSRAFTLAADYCFTARARLTRKKG